MSLIWLYPGCPLLRHDLFDNESHTVVEGKANQA